MRTSSFRHLSTLLRDPRAATLNRQGLLAVVQAEMATWEIASHLPFAMHMEDVRVVHADHWLFAASL